MGRKKRVKVAAGGSWFRSNGKPSSPAAIAAMPPKALARPKRPSTNEFQSNQTTERASSGKEKPEPAIFELALTRLGVEPHEALHVGDHPEKDAAGALAVGMRAVLVDRSGTMTAPAGAIVVDGLEALPTLLRAS